MTLGQLEDNMSYSEFQSWVKYYGEEPFGDVRADLRAGVVASTLARVMGGNKRARPLDFMPIVKAQKLEDEAAQSVATRMRHVFESNLGALRLRRTKLNLRRGN